MSESENEIVEILRELRDLQREELSYRRTVLDETTARQLESLTLQRTANRQQQVSLGRQKQAIVAQRFAIITMLFLNSVLAVIAYSLLAK